MNETLLREQYLDLEGGQILYLTKNPVLIENQLRGERIGPLTKDALLDNVSTDAYPTRACFRFDQDFMARKALTGLSLGGQRTFPDNALKDGQFRVLVAGPSFGYGSSREHFVASLKAAGIKLILVPSIERICAQNCQNIGLPYIVGDNFDRLLPVIEHTSRVPLDLATADMDEISADVVRSHGLFSYLANFRGTRPYPKPTTHIRAMTSIEKIVAKNMRVPNVKPGDTGFINPDMRYSYEIFLPFSYALLRDSQSASMPIQDPKSILLFYDHSVLDESDDALNLASQMRQIARHENILLFDGNRLEGTEGICHTVMLDRYAKPGEIIVGTDSHTCTLGAVGSLAFGIGATEWAAALVDNAVRLTVPQTVRFDLQGTLSPETMSKDIMLYLLAQDYIRSGEGVGKVFEYTGSTLDSLIFDEQVVFTNMSIEGGALTGFIPLNRVTKSFLLNQRGLTASFVDQSSYVSDPNAEYARRFEIDVSSIEPYIALPGNPKNGVPISQVLGERIDRAFIGSCTGSKYHDIAEAARVLNGRRISTNVELTVSPSSRSVYERAVRDGFVKIIEDAGGVVTPSGCGACVNFGPGSVLKGERCISTTNRNLRGRMGPGDVFLANPRVVSASAIEGKISLPTS